MRIILDLQGTQGESSYRGIGRYTLGLAKAIARNAGEHEVWLALNAAFPDTVDTLRAEFSDLVDRKRIRIFHPSGDCAEIFPENVLRARVAEKLREAFLGSLNPDLVQNFSLFEGFLDNVVTSIDTFETNYFNAATLYDLIPLANPDTHLANPQHKAWYFRKIKSLRRADHLLAISKYSRAEALNLLQLPEPTVSVIGGGIEDIFRPITLSTDSKLEVWNSYGIVRSFILSLHSGTEPHKNAKGLIESYALLPEHLRRKYQLVLAGNIPTEERLKLHEHASISGLTANDLVVTGRIDQTDLVALYSSCQLYVCPSFHEGLGLPPLEAMACGAPAIGSNLTAVPEVIGREDALFNPADPMDIAAKISEVLDQPDFLRSLKEHGQEHVKKFTWDACGQRALNSFEQLYDETKDLKQGRRFLSLSEGGRPKLAVVTPMPPEKTGIADYCSELIPMLSRHYDITLVVDQVTVKDTWAEINTDIRNLAWFEENARQFDRILYQVGNSPFHKHMFELMERFAGVLVLHDFFLSSAMQWMSESQWKPLAMENALYRTHGYRALLDAYTHGMDYAKLHYPCNGQVLDAAAGIIAHSKYTKHKVTDWLGSDIIETTLIPHLRVLPAITDFRRTAARTKLGLLDDDFLVVSFGLIDQTKLNHCLLEAWLQSHLAADPHCRLVFVGEQHGGDYGQHLSTMLKGNEQINKIIFTGFADRALYQSYLEAADTAVQLRTSSRGETSGTVLDCLAYGVPLVINAHGTNSEIPTDIVEMLPDEFEIDSLGKSLERFRQDKEYRHALSAKGRKYINEYHHPASIAQQYHDAIERFSEHHWRKAEQRLVSYAVELGNNELSKEALRPIVQTIVTNRPIFGPRTLWVDITMVAENDLQTGVERVTRAVASGLLITPPAGYHVELVHLTTDGSYHTAHTFACKLLGLPIAEFEERPAIPQAGDIFFGLDLVGGRLVKAKPWLLNAHRAGTAIFFFIHDLLPVTHPEFFPAGSDIWFKDWLSLITSMADGLICNSKTTADTMKNWISSHEVSFDRIPQVAFSHLGADMDASTPTDGIPDFAENVLTQLDNGLSFLMVGTIEPRKAHAQILSAFDHLWDKDGLDVNLIIVGKEGWKGLPEKDRRYITNLVTRLRAHPKAGKNLYWLEGISDEFLSVLYSKCHALIAASWAEGFGLPLAEASHHNIHVIARDIDIFREIAASNAFYFNANHSEDIAAALQEWIQKYRSCQLPPVGKISCRSWYDCCLDITATMNTIFQHENNQ